MIFVIIVVVGFVIFATQAGAKESKILSSPFACIFFLVVVGGILYFIWTGASITVLHH
jgi:hypothetical protein